MPPKREVFKCRFPGCETPPFEGKWRRQYLSRHEAKCPCNPANKQAPKTPPPIINNGSLVINNNTTINTTTNITYNYLPNPERSFGNEDVQSIISKLTPNQLETLLKYPEDAMTFDLPNLVWFNLDLPHNHTLNMDEGGQMHAFKGRTWDPIQPIDALRASLGHFESVKHACRGQYIHPIHQLMLQQYARIINDDLTVNVSPYCPYRDITGPTMSSKQMTNDLARTVRENCQLPREDWVRTVPYADGVIDCADTSTTASNTSSNMSCKRSL